MQTLAKRFFARKILLRRHAADYDRFGAASTIRGGKEPSFQQRYVQRTEVSGTGSPVKRIRLRNARRNGRMLGNGESIILPVSRSRDHRPKRHGAYTRHGAHPLQ